MARLGRAYPAPTIIARAPAAAAVELGPVREFDGTDDFIRVAAGGVSSLGTGAYTIATLCRKPNADVGATFWTCNAATPSTHGVALIETVAEYQLFHEGNVAGFGSAPAPADNVWTLVIVTKAAGTATPRIHIYNYNTASWHHSNATATVPNLAAGRDSAQFGGGPSNFYAGRSAAAAAWHGTVLSDGQCETMEAALQAWADLTPDALWGLNQASIATPVDDLTGGGADQTAITGTVVVTTDAPVPFDFDVSGGVVGEVTATTTTTSTVTGAVNRNGAVTATTTAGSTVTAVVNRAAAVTATTTSGGTRTGIVGRFAAVTGTTTAGSTVTGSLGGGALTGDIDSTVTAGSTVSGAVAATGAVTATTTASSTVTASVGRVGAVAAATTAGRTTAVTIGTIGAVTGTTTTSSTVTAVVNRSAAVTATTTSTSTVTGSTVSGLIGTVTSTTTAGSAVTATVQKFGAVTSTTTTGVTTAAVVARMATVTGTTTATSTVTAVRAITAAITATTTAGSTVTAATVSGLSAAITATTTTGSTVTAVVTGIPVVGSSRLVLTPVGSGAVAFTGPRGSTALVPTGSGTAHA